MKTATLTLVLILFAFATCTSLANVSLVSNETAVKQSNGPFGAILKLIEAGQLVWDSKDMIRSCGNYYIINVKSKIVFMWMWQFTRKTYIFNTETMQTEYIDGCNDDYITNPGMMHAAQYNIASSIASCEGGYRIYESRSEFLNCMNKIFTLNEIFAPCLKCYFGCPKHTCKG